MSITGGAPFDPGRGPSGGVGGNTFDPGRGPRGVLGGTGDGFHVISDWTQPGLSTTIAAVPRDTLAGVSDTFERQLNVAALNEPCRVTYGNDRVGFQIATALNYGTGIVVAGVWGYGAVQAIGSLTVNNATPPGTVIATHYTGTTSQTADAKLVAAFGSLGITHSATLAGIAYSVIEFQPGADIGDIAAIVQGVKVYDPRDVTQTLGTPSTYKWSDNPALALADLITNTVYGWGKTIDWTTVTTAANACDAIVSGEKKRLVGITIDSRKTAEEWVDVLRAHAGCFVVRSGAIFKLIPDATATSVKTYSKAANNIIKGTVGWSIKDVDQQPNVIQVTYTDTSATPWKTATAIYPTTGLPPTGEELRLSRRQMTGVQRYSQAMRECIEFFNHSRLEALQQTWDTFAESVAVEPGDVLTFNDGGLSSGITYRLLSRQMVKKGRWRLTGQKYDPAAFDSSAAATPTSSNTTLPSAGTPPAVASLTLTEEAISVPAGSLPQSKIRATWPGVVYPFFQSYRVVVTNAAGTVVSEGLTTGTTWLSDPVGAFSTYTVTVRALSSIAQGPVTTGTITLVSLGIDSLATVWSQYITSSAGWTFTNVETYKLWAGDTALRMRTLAAAEQIETITYTGANQSTPGKLSQLLDLKAANFASPATAPIATSPVFDIGTQRAIVAAIFNITQWLNLYQGAGAAADVGTGNQTLVAFNVFTSVSASPTMSPSVTAFGARANGTGRYIQFSIQSALSGFGGGFVVGRTWALELDPGGIAALMPTVTDQVTGTSSATGPVTVTLPRKYIVANNPIVQPVAPTSCTASPSNLTLSETLTNTVDVNVFDQTGARVALPFVLTITGVSA